MEVNPIIMTQTNQQLRNLQDQETGKQDLLKLSGAPRQEHLAITGNQPSTQTDLPSGLNQAVDASREAASANNNITFLSTQGPIDANQALGLTVDKLA